VYYAQSSWYHVTALSDHNYSIRKQSMGTTQKCVCVCVCVCVCAILESLCLSRYLFTFLVDHNSRLDLCINSFLFFSGSQHAQVSSLSFFRRSGFVLNSNWDSKIKVSKTSTSYYLATGSSRSGVRIFFDPMTIRYHDV
jgi:hypothetical protein